MPEAFELGANIIAYATGLEPPQPRGTKISIGKGGKDPTVIPRGYFSVGQITKYVGDAKVAPKAMRNLMERMNRDFGLDVELDVTVPALAQADAEALTHDAHKVCPYSNATKGNIDVKLVVHGAAK